VKVFCRENQLVGVSQVEETRMLWKCSASSAEDAIRVPIADSLLAGRRLDSFLETGGILDFVGHFRWRVKLGGQKVVKKRKREGWFARSFFF
jgi:hypothetical protein